MEGQTERKCDGVGECTPFKFRRQAQCPHPSYMWQTLHTGITGFAQDHLHWITWFVGVCWPTLGEEKAVIISTIQGSSSEFRLQVNQLTRECMCVYFVYVRSRVYRAAQGGERSCISFNGKILIYSIYRNHMLYYKSRAPWHMLESDTYHVLSRRDGMYTYSWQLIKAGMLDLVYMDQFNILNKYNDVQSISLVHICRQHWT